MTRLATWLSALLLCAVANEASAYCVFGPPYDWNGHADVPVWLHPALKTSLQHADGTFWTDYELEQELQGVLQTFAQHSGANLPRMYYAGVRSMCLPSEGDLYARAACRIHDAIVVMPAYNFDHSYTTWDEEAADPAHEGVLVALLNNVNGTAEGIQRWEHFESPLTGGSDVLAGTLTHELGHAVGVAHYCRTGCTTWPCSVMDVIAAGQTDQTTEWYLDDVNALRWVCGAETLPTSAQRESLGAATWSNAPSFDFPAIGAQFAISSSRTSRTMFAMYHNRSDQLPRTTAWDWDSGAWQPWTYNGGTPATPGRPGAAFDSAGGLAFGAFSRSETATYVAKGFGLTRHTNPGVAPTTYYFTPSGGTRRHGTSLAYDPRNDVVVQAFRLSNGELRVQLVTKTGSFDSMRAVKDDANVSMRSFHQPSVTCGDASIPYNCLLAWTEPGRPTGVGHYHILRWVHFRYELVWGAWSAARGPIMSLDFIMHGPPVVAYKGPAGDAGAYVVTWRTEASGAHYVWTMRKPADASASWGYVCSRGGFTRRAFPALGSAFSWGELVSVP